MKICLKLILLNQFLNMKPKTHIKKYDQKYNTPSWVLILVLPLLLVTLPMRVSFSCISKLSLRWRHNENMFSLVNWAKKTIKLYFHYVLFSSPSFT